MQRLLFAVASALLLVLSPRTANAQFVLQYETPVNQTAGLNIVSTCSPLVFGTGGAILCWTMPGATSGATYVLPTDPEQDRTVSAGVISTPPVATGPMTGTVSSADYIAVLDPLGVEFFQYRNLTTDVPMTFAADFGIALVASSYPDQISAYNFSNAFQTPLWTAVLAAYPSPSFFQPLYYRAFFYVLRGTTILKYVAVTGDLVDVWLMPCNISSNAKIITVNFGADENGPLDAFIAYGYSSTQPPSPTFQICRFSHNNAASMSWNAPITISASVTIDNVVGVNGLLIFSGSQGGNSYFSKIVNATTGVVLYTFLRQAKDVRSYPVSVPMPTPTTCAVAMLVQQWNGAVVAYCAEDPLKWLWVQNGTQCYHSAVVYSATQILCNEYDTALVLLNIADGSIAMRDASIRPAFAPSLSVENGGTAQFVWITSTHAVLRGYTIGALAGAGSPSSGIGAGYVVLIIIAVLGIVGGGGFFAFNRNAARKAKYEAVN
jgi:hypothetical protein